MRTLSPPAPVLLAAAYLHIPSRRLRALARGEDHALREWLGADTSHNVAHARHRAREAINRLQHLNARIVALDDPEYPPGLCDLDEPPPFLFVRGCLSSTGIAIVGSRTAPEEAATFAHELARRCGEPVISGLAAGIDAAAHRGAIAGSLQTIAYVATGLGVTYPPHHGELEEEIVRHGGAIVAERLPDEPATKWAFVHRDRLQAAHARATVLVASEANGGAMQTMRFAKTLKRRRFALQRVDGEAYAGNALALADGAAPLPFDVEKALRRLR